MRLETFFEKFDTFADAPDAVAKMRELVLQLAVQGKLVDQNLCEGDAAQLLAGISKERDTRGAKLRTPNEPETAADKEPLFPIPPNWAWTHLGSIALQIQYGYTASADPNATEIRMLRITDIQNNRVDWPSVPGCQIELDEAEKYLLSPNDILIARTGGTIGKSFIVPDAPVRSVFASYLIRVTPPHSMAARYLKTFLESPLYWSQLRQMSSGTGQPNVNGQALGRLEIPLPPLAEQKRIVAKVDELMALCDRLEAQQRERETRHAALARASLARFADAPTPANLHFLFQPSCAIPPADLRKSILTLAVQGKLVPQDPCDEQPSATTGEELDEPFEVPDNWDWVRLADLQPEFQNGASSRGDSDGTQVIVIRLADVRNRRIALDSPRAIVISNEQITRYELRAGDTLITRVNGSADIVGTFVPVPDDLDAIYCDHFIRMRIDPSRLAPGYTALVGESQLVRDQIKSLFITTAGQKTVNQSHIGALRIPLPPLAEQRRIVVKVDELISLVDALEKQIATARATGATLVEAAVAELSAEA